jgi:hypothetical protein
MSTEELLGTGINVSSGFDIVVSSGGSIDLISGIDVLGRDIAFGVSAAVNEQDLLGRRINDDALADIETAVLGVAQRDSRVSSVENIDTRPSDSEQTRVDVELAIVAETDERGEFVISL